MVFITNWTQNIIVSVIIATIIEMLLPNNSNGKYVKVVIGIFVLFTIMSPMVNKLKGKNAEAFNDLDSYIDDVENDSVQASNLSFNNEEAIKLMYEENLKVDIKSKINQKGYLVGDVRLNILDNDEYTLDKIEVKISGKSDGPADSLSGGNSKAVTIVENIENIKISLGGSKKDDKKQQEKSVISESERRKLKEYLSGVYEVKEKNVEVL